jgi:chemotaxis protein methyltransferase CheR
MASTYCFRDAQKLDMLIGVASTLLSGQRNIRIWDVGCAHGLEPHTLAMLLKERMSEFVFRNVKIFATDNNPAFSAKVTLGNYPEEELSRIPTDFLDRYFQAAEEPGQFKIVNEIRSKVEYSVHDLLSLKPIREDFSLIICRNALLHLDERQRSGVLRMFHSAMRKDGMLAMEHTQKMRDELLFLFKQAAPNVQLYRKMDIPSAPASSLISGLARRIDPPDNRSLPHRGCKPKVMADK